MFNGINPGHVPAAAPLQDGIDSPVRAGPSSPVVPQAPSKPTRQQRRAALQQAIEDRPARNDVEAVPSASLQQGGAQEGFLQRVPPDVLLNIARMAGDGPAIVKAVREVSRDSRLNSLAAVERAVVEDPADLARVIARYPELSKITLVGYAFSDAVLQQLAGCAKLRCVELVRKAPDRTALDVVREHLPKDGPVDPLIQQLADGTPLERIADHQRIIDRLQALGIAVVGGAANGVPTAEELNPTAAKKRLVLPDA